MTNRISAYLSHPIRGNNGDDATDGEIAKNIQDAILAAQLIRIVVPELDLYVPAEHDEIIQILWKSGQLTPTQILDADCGIISRRDCCLFYLPHSQPLSSGMDYEMQFAVKTNTPYTYVHEFNDTNIEELKRFLHEVKQNKSAKL